MYRKILLAALFTVAASMLSSAFVNAVGAVSVCNGWPGCEGLFSPPPELDLYKAWSQVIHRGVEIAGLLLTVAALALSFSGGQPGGLALAAIGLAGQNALAAIAPAYQYHPLLLGLPPLLTLAAMALIYRARLATDEAASGPLAKAGIVPRLLVGLGILWLFVQTASGTWMAATHSGMACPDLPTCLGHWWPEVDYAQAFAFWNGLLEGSNTPLGLAERVAVNWTHRVSGIGLVVLLTAIGIQLSSGRYGKRASRNGMVISALACAQLLSAMLAVKLRLPLLATLAHAALVPGLWLHLLRASHQLRNVPPLAGLAPTAPQALKPSPEAEIPPSALPEERAEPVSLLQRLRKGLSKTGGGLAGLLAGLGGTRIDDQLLEDMETTLLMADVGVDATQELVKGLSRDYPKDEPVSGNGVRSLLKKQMLDMLAPCNHRLVIDTGRRPFVILVVGVNGVGKTTTIGKLARRLKSEGHSVMLAAGDTFRAAAMEQLQTWGERNGIQVVAQHSGADSASVIFDAMQSAQAKGIDILIADTAGRLHTKSNLMEELRKIKRILGKLDETAPHEVLMVLDAGTGQNAIAQARQFHETVGLTGIAVTKLDGTAKGGVIFALARLFGIPIRYIGVGEGVEDLQDFHAETFVDALLGQETA